MPALQPCPACLGYSPERANCPQCEGSGLSGIFSKVKKFVKKVVKTTVSTAKTPKGALTLATGIVTGGVVPAAMILVGGAAAKETADALAKGITKKGVDKEAARRMADAIAGVKPQMTPEEIEQAAKDAAEKYAARGGLMKVGLGVGAAVLGLGLVGLLYFATRGKKVKEIQK